MGRRLCEREAPLALVAERSFVIRRHPSLMVGAPLALWP
jgi:hypothetical protein